MSDKARTKRAEALLLRTFCAAALIGTVVVFYALGLLNGRETERRGQLPAAYSQEAKADADRACASLDGAAQFECVYDRVEASQEQARGEQDLSAQQRAASAALASALVSALTLVVSAIGVWLVRQTLLATLQAVEDTSLATVAMGEANQIAREALVLQGRAWITVDARLEGPLVFSDQSKEVRVPVLFDITNAGTNPATNISIKVALRTNLEVRTKAIQQEIADDQRTVPEGSWFPNVTLFAGQTFKQIYEVGSGEEALAELRSNFEGMAVEQFFLPLIIVGCVQYRLAGSKELHQTGFTYQIEKHPIAGGTTIFEKDLPLSSGKLRLRLPVDGHGLID